MSTRPGWGARREAIWALRLGTADLLIDAVVGTGFKPPLRGLAAAVRELVAKADAAVAAVDLPSGWDADSTEETADGAYRADAVVTFTRPKMAHVFGHLTGAAKDGGTFGPVVVAEIGSPDAVWLSQRKRVDLGGCGEGDGAEAWRGM